MPTIQVGRQMLDKHFISTALGQEVTEFKIRKGSHLNESVVSNLVSLDARLSSGEILHLIYKCMNPTPATTPIGTEINPDSLPPEVRFRESLEGYPIEIKFYQIIAPRLSSLPSREPISLPLAKLYAAGHEPYEGFLLLEDLRPLGFKNADKFKGLKASEVSLVMESLARLHAQSYHLLRTEPNTLFGSENKETSVFSKKHPLRIRLPEGNISVEEEQLYKGIKYLLSRRKGRERQDLAEKMSKFEGKVGPTILAPWIAAQDGNSEEHFPVLLHGDLWTNNILFRYDHRGQPEEVRLIDFQQVRRGSIFEDLHYFFFNSTTPEFRKEHLESSLEIYFENFASSLDSLGAQLPRNFTKESLLSNYRKNLPYGFCYFVFAIAFQLGVFAPPPSPSPMENEIDGKKFNNFEKPAQKSIAQVVKEFMSNTVGYLTVALENSPKGLNRLEKVVEEMVELQVL